LLTLGDLSVEELSRVIKLAIAYKTYCGQRFPSALIKNLTGRNVALLFSKRSTRTRVAAETSTHLLGGHSMFLGSGDIQLGVNESLEDSAKVIGSMVDGIFARVNKHEEVAVSASSKFRVKQCNAPDFSATSVSAVFGADALHH
jgi:ornithine carbamoyltransferase